MDEITRKKFTDKMTANLPELRATLHLSQSALAERLGVSRQQVVAIENLKRNMSWNIFLSLVLIFSLNDATLRMLQSLDIFSPELFQKLEGRPKSNREVGL